MLNIIKIAFRNLIRQKRRSLLTVSIIAFGVIAVILFTALAGAFKAMMIGQITDAMLGHIQIHRKGYLSSLDNLPLDKIIKEGQWEKIKKILAGNPYVDHFSSRLLMGGMISNYLETTNIKVAAVFPEQENKVIPLLADRIKKGRMIKQGEILLPEMITSGMKLQLGSDVVLIVNNAAGSVNGRSFRVAGIIESSIGPTGKYGYIHFEDATALLRMAEPQVSEIAIRLKKFSRIESAHALLSKELAVLKNKKGKPHLEIHTWKKLTPFSNIARMIDMMAVFIQVILVAIVLISIMNVMIMAVYERIREIGTIAAIGTLPGKIRWLFLCEGLLIGLFGGIAGNLLGAVIVVITKFANITIAFGRQDKIPIDPVLPVSQMGIILFGVALISVIASLQPAFKASRMEPIDALRHN